MQAYQALAIEQEDQLGFGVAPKPVKTRRGMTLGGGVVYPEINFTLSNIDITAETMPEIRKQYRHCIEAVLLRAAELEAPGLIVEFETLPPMTHHPEWGLDLVKNMLEAMEEAWQKHELASVFRMTPNDNREFIRPPIMRSGEYWENMLKLFEGSAEAGAELLSIESVGGKELHDEALQMGDIAGVIFAQAVVGVRDMRFLWSTLKQIADRHGVMCAGDTACGFGNTAMVLAEQNIIPRTFAAVVRAVSAVRSLVAYECGAVGPGKDCGYENPFLKAITGCPMSMEGKTAACAHKSPLGNIAAATCDAWSNESVQNIRLLSDIAPVCYVEQLIYDCRLMNQALADGPDAARQFRDWLVRSDSALDPQAFILTPHNVIRIAESIVQADDHYLAARSAALQALHLIREGYREGEVKLPDREVRWLGLIEDALHMMPEDESAFIEQQLALVEPGKFRPEEYELTDSACC
ncbi:MAG: methanol--corrinoid methyltransferase [Phycisphaeraceae bacterium]